MRQIGNTLNEIDDMIIQGYNERSRIQDRMFDSYSRAVRGVDLYNDPGSSAAVELPTGFDRAWSDGNRYIISDDPLYDPNSDQNLRSNNWQQLKRLDR